jgi:hypothetical protein
MAQGEAAMAVAVDGCYTNSVTRAFEAADESVEPVLGGIEAAIAMAEADPAGARAVLWRLQGDWETLDRLDEQVGGEPTLATLRVGAAIQLARAELASPAPQLRRLLPEMMEWLGRRELSAAD